VSTPYIELQHPNWPQVREDLLALIHPNIQDQTATSVFYLDDWHYQQPDRFTKISSLRKMINDLGLMANWKCTGIVVSYQDGLSPHLDTGDCDHSLVLPILNTDQTDTIFYHARTEPTRRTIGAGPVTYLGFDLDNVQETHRVTIRRPTLIQIKVPHSVQVNAGPVPRVSCSLRMRGVTDQQWSDLGKPLPRDVN